MIPFISRALLDSILAKNFLYQSVDTAIRITITRNIITNDGIEKTVDKKADKYSDTISTCNAECECSGARVGRARYHVKRDSYPTSSPGSSRFPSCSSGLSDNFSFLFFLLLSFKT